MNEILSPFRDNVSNPNERQNSDLESKVDLSYLHVFPRMYFVALSFKTFTLTYLSLLRQGCFSVSLKSPGNDALDCLQQRRLTIMERCKNPWNGKCENNDIELYIIFRGERKPICKQCWSKLAEKDQEW